MIPRAAISIVGVFETAGTWVFARALVGVVPELASKMSNLLFGSWMPGGGIHFELYACLNHNGLVYRMCIGCIGRGVPLCSYLLLSLTMVICDIFQMVKRSTKHQTHLSCPTFLLTPVPCPFDVLYAHVRSLYRPSCVNVSLIQHPCQCTMYIHTSGPACVTLVYVTPARAALCCSRIQATPVPSI